MAEYAEGGYVEGSVPVGLGGCVIDPDECIVRAEDVRAGRWVCSHPEHPTRASACREVRRG